MFHHMRAAIIFALLVWLGLSDVFAQSVPAEPAQCVKRHVISERFARHKVKQIHIWGPMAQRVVANFNNFPPPSTFKAASILIVLYNERAAGMGFFNKEGCLVQAIKTHTPLIMSILVKSGYTKQINT